MANSSPASAACAPARNDCSPPLKPSKPSRPTPWHGKRGQQDSWLNFESVKSPRKGLLSSPNKAHYAVRFKEYAAYKKYRDYRARGPRQDDARRLLAQAVGDLSRQPARIAGGA